MSRLFFLFGILALVMCTGLVPQGQVWAQYPGHISSYVIDAQSGEILSQSDADLQRYPASLTKMMTLYLTFRALEAHQITLDEQVPVSIHAAIQKPSKLGLVPGTRLTVEQAILALVTKSANDAACALGEFLGGGDEVRFAGLMTQQARALGMSNTTFRNASGLPDPDQVTTAHDLGTLAQHLIKDFPGYYHYFDVPQFYFHRRLIPNHDPMLKIYAGADGLKTGYTDLAGRNLVTSAVRGDTRLIGVVMGASSNTSRSLTMANLLDRGFESKGLPRQPLMHSSAPVFMVRGRGRMLRKGPYRAVELANGTGRNKHGVLNIRHAGHVRMVSLHSQGVVHHNRSRIRS